MDIKTIEQAKEAVGKFRALQNKYLKFGASDTEPNVFLSILMNRILHRGMSWEKVFVKEVYRMKNPWELYETVSGWKRVSDTLTRHVRKLIEALQNAPYVIVQELLDYYGYKY